MDTNIAVPLAPAASRVSLVPVVSAPFKTERLTFIFGFEQEISVWFMGNGTDSSLVSFVTSTKTILYGSPAVASNV